MKPAASSLKPFSRLRGRLPSNLFRLEDLLGKHPENFSLTPRA
jgi:hypothetical protein